MRGGVERGSGVEELRAGGASDGEIDCEGEQPGSVRSGRHPVAEVPHARRYLPPGSLFNTFFNFSNFILSLALALIRKQ